MKQLLKDRFMRDNLIVFFGSLVISLLNYLYYPVLARLMSVQAYGETQTLVSIFNQVGLIFSAINIVTVVFVADKEKGSNNHFLTELQRLTLYLMLIIGLIVVIASPILRNFFQFNSTWPFLVLILALLANLIFIFWSSYLQGRREFVAMNLLGIFGATGKLLVPVILVLAGLGSFGAVFGLFIAQIIALVIMGLKYKMPSIFELLKLQLPKWHVLRSELRYTGLVFVVTFLTAMLYSGDVLLVKHFQDPDQAGIYSGIASIARIIFFITLPFAVVLLPSVYSDWDNKLSVLKRSMLFTVTLGGITCLIFSIFERQIVELLVGRRYEAYSYLLPKLSAAILLISIANLLIYYLLSIRSLLSLWASSAGVVLFVGLSLSKHGSLNTIIDNLLISSGLTVIMIIIIISIMPRVRNILKLQF